MRTDVRAVCAEGKRRLSLKCNFIVWRAAVWHVKALYWFCHIYLMKCELKNAEKSQWNSSELNLFVNLTHSTMIVYLRLVYEASVMKR